MNANSDWELMTVGEIAAEKRNALVGGPFGSNLVSSDYVDSGVPVIRGGNMGNRWVTGEFAFVSEEKAISLEANIAQPGDVIFTQRGTLGQVSLVPEGPYQRYLISQSQMKLTVNDDIADPLFIYYLFTSPDQQEYIHQHAIQSGVPHTNLGILRDTPIKIPPLSEQRSIAHILGTLDDKIELNRRMSATLEAMARALFKSWFVDFDPVRASVEGRDPGLPRPLLDLFPTRLVESELGEIPEGWQVRTLADLSILNPEVWTKETRPSELNYVELSNTKWGRIEAVTSYEAMNAPSRAQRVLRARDTIVGTVRPGNGSFAFISEGGLTGSTGFAVLRPRVAMYGEFVYLAATAADNIDILAQLADGAAYPAVRPDLLAATPIVNPSYEAVSRFSQIARSLFVKIAKNERESHTLAALRDALLPKLIYGELRVEDAERFIGRAF